MYKKVNGVNSDFMLTSTFPSDFTHILGNLTKSILLPGLLFWPYTVHTHKHNGHKKLRDAWSVLQFTASVSARSLGSLCIPSWTYRHTCTTDWQQPLPELLFRSWSRHLHKSAPYSPKPPRLQKQSSVTFPFFPSSSPQRLSLHFLKHLPARSHP